MAPQPRLTQELQGIPRSQRSFNLNTRMFRKGDRDEKGNRRDLRHSAHESRVAPRRRFLAGSGSGDGSRLLGVGEDMTVGLGKSDKERWVRHVVINAYERACAMGRSLHLFTECEIGHTRVFGAAPSPPNPLVFAVFAFDCPDCHHSHRP
jgi:hypothetical protein